MSISSEQAYCIQPGKHIKLANIPTRDKTHVLQKKAQRQAYVCNLGLKLDALQNTLYAEGKHKVLVVLQGMDTSGKDGTIRKVFQSVDPQGVRVVAFKVPSALEAAHDFLWRVHGVTPKAGELVIFNRSHYEDVLTTVVHGMIDKKQCRQRIEHIKDFERLLSETGTTVLKFFLHISKDEQRERLQERIDIPAKHWKFDPSDLKDRELWESFQTQYEYVLNATNTAQCPWYIIPADSKSSRNQIMLDILIARLSALKMDYPHVHTDDWPKVVQ